MWGLGADDVLGKNFFALDIGLPFDRIRTAIRSASSDGSCASTFVVDAINRSGKAFECRVRILPLMNRSQALYGVILMMSEDLQPVDEQQAVAPDPA
jgi:two-component system, chemotaxis family, CheB/CheR fusion protein